MDKSGRTLGCKYAYCLNMKVQNEFVTTWIYSFSAACIHVRMFSLPYIPEGLAKVVASRLFNGGAGFCVPPPQSEAALPRSAEDDSQGRKLAAGKGFHSTVL